MPASAFEGSACVCPLAKDICDGECTERLMTVPSYFACLRLQGRRALVVGGGHVALEKVEGLLAADASVRVVAPDFIDELRQLGIELVERGFEDSDIDDAFVVVAATDDTELNIRISHLCESRHKLVNVADVPPLCNFILPAVSRSGPVSIAISTSGASPALAQRMRDEIASNYGEPYAIFAQLLDSARHWAKANLDSYAERRDFFAGIVNSEPDPVELIRQGRTDEVAALIEQRKSDS